MQDPIKKQRRNEKKAEKARQWRADNPGLSAKKAKERYHKNPERQREKTKKWRNDHPEAIAKIYRTALLKKYGLTDECYNKMLHEQNNSCSICLSMESGTEKGVFCVDHDHNSGIVRGLLCRPCNIALGLFKDNETTLMKAIEYLQKKRE